MGNQHRIPHKIKKLRQNSFNVRRIHPHTVIDAGKLGNLKWNRDLWVHKAAEPLRDPSLLHLYCADLNNPVRNRAETGRLQIEYHKGIL